MNTKLHYASRLRSRVTFFLTNWLRQLIQFLTVSRAVIATTGQTPLFQWYQMLGARLLVKQRAYLMLMGLGLFAPLATQAQLLSIANPAPACAGGSITLLPVLSGFTGVAPNLIKVTAVAPAGINVTTSTSAGITLSTDPALASGTYSLTVDAGVHIPAVVVGGITVTPAINLDAPTIVVPITINATPATPTAPSVLTALTGGSVSLAGLCPVGSVLVDATGNLVNLTINVTGAAQPLTLLCRSTTGNCLSGPLNITIPPAVVNLISPLLSLAPVVLCSGQNLNLQLSLTNGATSLLGQLNLANVSVRDAGGTTINASALDQNGLLTISAANLVNVQFPLTVTVSALSGFASAQAVINPTLVTTPTTPTAPSVLTALTGGSVSLAGLCPVGSVLVDATGNLVNLTVNVTGAAQPLTLLCRSTTGNCLSGPLNITIPPAVVNLISPLLSLAPVVLCSGQNLNLQLSLTNGATSLLGQLNLANVSVQDAGGTTINASALDQNGLLTISAANLVNVQFPLTVTVSALSGFASAQAVINPTLVTTPTTPTAPSVLTALTGGSVSLAGLCPVGSVLVDATGNLVNLTVTVTGAAQPLTLLCRSTTGNCLSGPLNITIPPAVVNLLTPLLSLAPVVLCSGQNLNLQLSLTNGATSLLGQLNLANVSVQDAGGTTINASALDQNGLLTISAANLVNVQFPLTVTVSALSGFASAQAVINPTLVTTPTTPTAPSVLTALTGGSVSLAGLCPVGSVLVDATGNLVNLTVTVTGAAQPLTLLCRSTTGNCLSGPLNITIPPAVVNLLTPLLSLAPVVLCSGQNLNLQLSLTNGATSLLGQLNLANVSVQDAGGTTINASALDQNGLLTISAANLVNVQFPLTVTVSALSGFASASAVINPTLVTTPGTPTTPSVLTALTGGSVSLAGLCPVGSVLVDATGNLVNLTINVTGAAQPLTLLCRSTTGNCLSGPLNITIPPAVVNLISPLLSLAPVVLCSGQNLNLQLSLTNGATSLLGQLGLANVSVRDAGGTTINASALDQNGLLTISAANLVNVQFPLTVTVSALSGFASASAVINPTLVTTPGTPTTPSVLTALTGGSVSLAGLCPVGSVLVDATGNLVNLTINVTGAAQPLTLLCRSTTGNCLSGPLNITIPPAVVNLISPLLSLAPVVLCSGQNLNLQLSLTNGATSLLGQLNLANVSVQDAGGTTINASALDQNGLLTISAANLVNVQFPLTVTVSALSGFASAQAVINPTLVTTPTTPTAPSVLTALTGGSVSLAGLCPVGSVLVDATGNLVNLTVNVTGAAQPLTLLCRSTTGNCLSGPLNITIPPAVVNLISPLLSLAPVVLCSGQNLNLQLSLTNGATSLLGQLNLANVSVQDAGGTTINASALDQNGLLTISAANLVNVQFPLTVTVSALSGFASASAVINPTLVTTPGTPTTPSVLTALTGGSVSLAGLCPVGSVLVDATGNLVNLTVTVTGAAQPLTLLCRSTTGNCLSGPLNITIPPAVVNLISPLLSLAPVVLCSGQNLNLQLSLTNGATSLLGQLNLANVSVQDAGGTTINASALDQNGLLTISAANLVNVQFPLTVTVSALSGFASAQAVINPTLVTTPTTPTAPSVLTALTGGSVSLAGLCPVGSVLVDATGNLVNLTVTVTGAAQPLTLLCRSTTGNCLSGPLNITIPPAVVNLLTPLLSLAPVVLCSGQNLNLQLSLTNGATSLLGQLNLANVSVQDAGGTTINASALDQNGLLTISAANLVNVQFPLTVTVSALSGFASASAVINPTLVTTPGTPTTPSVLTALTGGSVSLAGLCPVGSVLVDATGNLVNLTINVTGAAQPLTLLCRSTTGNCLSGPLNITIPPAVVNLLSPLLSLAPVVLCSGQNLNLQLSLTNGATSLLGQLGLANVSVRDAGGTTINASALDQNGLLTISAANLVNVQFPLTVTVSALSGFASASAVINPTLVTTPGTPTTPSVLTALTGGSVSLAGLCPVGSVLVDATGNLVNLTVTVTGAAQPLTLLCRSTTGNCLSGPLNITIPPAVVNLISPLLSLAPVVLCSGQNLNLQLSLTNGATSLLGQLNLANVSVQDAGGTTINASALDQNGLLTISAANLVNVQFPLTVTVSALSGFASAQAVINPTLVTTPTTPTAPSVLTALTGGSVSLAGLCPVGSVLVDATGNLVNLTVNVTGAAQPLTLLCRSTTGNCLSGPLNITIPPAINPINLGLNILGPVASCLDQPISLTLVPTGGLLLSQLNLLNVTVKSPNGGNLALSALGSDGVLALSSQGLSTGLQTLTVTASVLNQPVVSTTVNLNLVATPGAPSQPGLLTATVGNSVSLAGLCPVGVLVDATNLSVLNLSVPVTASVQNLTVLCLNNPCVSLPTVLTIAAGVVTPVFTVSAAASICLGQPFSLTVIPSNFGLTDGLVTLSISGPIQANISAINSQGVATITNLPPGTQNLTVTATAAGVPVVSVNVPINVINSLQAPTVVTASGQPYPAGQTTVSVSQNSGNVIFTASCATGTPTYTGSNGSTGTGDITVPTATTGVVTYSVVCTAGGCVSPATVVSVTVTPAPVTNQPPVLVSGGIPSPQSATVGVGFVANEGQYFTDPENGPLTFTQTGLPASLTINPATGVVSGTPTVAATYTVTVTATDNGGLSTPGTFTLIVVPAAVVTPNQPPVLVSGGIPSPQSATVGVGFVANEGQYFSDPEGGPLTFTQTGLPSSLTINPATGVVSGTPTTAATYTVTVTATDNGGLSTPGTFTLIVVPAPSTPNQPPVLVSGGIPSPQSATVGVGFVLATGPYFTDPENQPLTFTQTGLPASLSISPSGVISGTPTVASTYTVTVTATDPGGLSVPSTFTLIVVPAPTTPNQPPVLVSGGIPSPQSATVGVGFTANEGQYFTDPEGGPLTFTQTGLPSSLTINPATGVVSGTPTVASTYTVTVTATDPGGLSTPGTFVLNVVPAPVVSPTIPLFGLLPLNPTVCIGNPLSVTVTGLGALSSLVDLSLTGGVATLTRNGDVLTLSNLVSGPQTLTLTASLLGSVPVSVPLDLTVLAPATPIIAASQTLVQGVGSVALTAIGCAPGETLIFSNGTGRIDITALGVTNLTVACQSQNGLCVGASVPVSVTVVPAPVNNQPPTLVNGGIPSPQSATVGVGFVANEGQYFSDPEGGPLTFTQTGLPSSLTINPATGVVSGTPTTAATYTVTVTATDNGGLSTPGTFTLIVVPAPSTPNQPPVLVSGGIPSPQSATVGVGFAANEGQYFSDPEGGPLTFTQTGLPASLSINPATGVVSGTPTVAATYTVTVTATDNGGLSTPGTFTLIVVPAPSTPNQPPVLVSGGIPSPQSATVGVGFVANEGQYFSDPEGGPLTFTQTGLPASLSINPATGVVSGTPTVAATYTVTVTATDNGGLSTPGTFTLIVVPAVVVTPNQPPVLVSGGIPSPQSATVGVGFVANEGQYFSDPEGGPLTFTQTGLPSSLTINPATGVVSGTPTVAATYTVTVTATDNGGLSTPGTFVLNVVPAVVVTPTIPLFGLLPLNPTVCIGNPLSVTVTGLGALSSLVDLSLTGGVATLTRNGDVLTLSNLVSGPQTLTLTASLLGSVPVSVPLDLTVLAPATPIIAASQTLVQGVGSVALTAIGCAPGETLIFSNGTGRIDITALGVTNLTVACQSQNGLCVGASVPVSVTVVPAPVNNQPPTLVNGGIPSPQSATVGVGFVANEGQYFSDPEGGPLTFTQTGLPASLSINPATGVVSGTPTVAATYTVTVTATDNGGLSTPGTFTLIVVPAVVVTPNQPPVLVSGGIPSPQSATVGVGFVANEGQYFTDPENGPLTFTQTGLPSSLTINPATGVVSGTPTVAATYTVTVTATDNGGLSTPGTFTLIVVPAPSTPNQPPVLVSGGIPSPQSATVGVGFVANEGQYFTDPEGGPLTFTQTGLPSSLTINPATGVVSGTPTVAATYTVTVTATDNGGLSTPGTFTLIVVPAVVVTPNQPPVLVSGGIPSPQSATVGVGFVANEGQYFSDPENGPLTFTQTGLPASLTINPATGVVSGTPTVAATYTVTVTATDNGGLSTPGTFTLIVVPAPVNNQPPVLVSGGIPSPQSATVGVGFVANEGQYFSDPEGGPLTFTQTGLPSSLTINPATGVVSGTPTVAATYTVTVTATDNGGLSTPGTFTLIVVPAVVVTPNQPPVLVSGGIPSPQSATVGVGFVANEGQYFTDPEGGPLSFTQTGLPSSLSINPATGVVSGTPTTAATYTVTVTATDNGGLSTPGTFTLIVVPAAVVTPNQPPVLVSGGIPSPQSATVGVGFVANEGQYFSDPEGGPLTFTQTGLPASLTINPATGVVSGTPTVAATYTVTVTATDNGGLSTPGTFTLIVVPAPVNNQPPVLVSGGIPSPQSATVGVGFAANEGQYFSDPEGGPLTFTQTGLPASLSINPATGVVSGTPTMAATYTVTVTATDNGGLSTPGTFTLIVVPAPVVTPNQPPVLVSGGIPSPQSATVGVGFVLATGPYFTDPTGDPLSFTQTGLPTSLSISPSGVISGTPTVAATYTVTVTATDPGGLSVPSTFTLNVVPAPVTNQPPVLLVGGIPSPQSATVGVGFVLAAGPYFTDPEGGPLTFTQTGLPVSLTINPATGVVTGTPTVAATYTVTVTATDNGGLTVPSTFTLVVVPTSPVVLPPMPPMLITTQIPSPQSATVGVGFVANEGQYFMDPNGDPLTFTQMGLPSSLSISPSGVISGTPTIAATYTVTVTATDPGGLSVSSTFTLIVAPAPVNNQPPMLTTTPISSPQSATVGVGYSTTTAAAFSDPNGQTLTYGAGPLPTGVSINPITGLISGTPTTSGTFTVVVTATNPQNLSVSTSYGLIVSPAPVATGPLAVTVVSYNCATGAILFGRLGGDPNQPVEYRAIGVRDWSTDPNGVIDAPVRADANNSTITVMARYVGNPASEVNFTFNFRNFCSGTPTNQPPVLVPPGIMSPQSATVNVPFSTSTAYAFTDPEGGSLTFTSGGLPAGLIINPITGVISGTPTMSGPFTVTVTATDNVGQPVSGTFVLNVSPAPTGGTGLVDLAIPKVDVSRRTPAPGERVRYVTNLRNESGQAGTNVVIQVQMPAGFVYSTDNSPTADLSSTVWAGTPTSAGTTYDPATNQVLIRVPRIEPGEDVALFFYGLVPTAQGKHYAYWQILSTDQRDPDSTPGNGFCNGEDDTQSIDTRVLIPTNAGADVELSTILISKASPAQNEDVTFTIPVRNNNGPGASTNVLTKLTLPASLSFISGITPGVTYEAATREVAYNAASIAVNEVIPFVFSARVVAPSGSAIKLQAEIKSADQFDYDSQFGNVLCNNYDDDQATLTFTVTGTNSTTTTPTSPTGTVGGSLSLVAPLYNCQTGDITFRTTGGDGTPIYFNSVGIVANSTNPNQNIAAGIRNDANSQPIVIRATQSGVTVTYTFDFRAYCAGTPPTSPTNRPPVMSQIPNYTAVVGVPVVLTLPAFTDPDGDPLTYTGVGFPTGFSLTVSNGQLQLRGTGQRADIFQVFITGTDPGGLSATRGFLLTVLNSGSTAPQTTSLALIDPQFNCETGAITFLTTGGDGSPIEYMAAGVKVWSTDPTGVLDRAVLTDPSAHVLTLMARQNGVIVSYIFDFRYYCWGVRQGAQEPVNQLSIKVMENPTTSQYAEFEIQGAEGQTLDLQLVDELGRIISVSRVEQSLMIERQRLPLGASAGIYILQASTPADKKTVKVMKR